MLKLGRVALASLLALALAAGVPARARAGHDEPVTNSQLPLGAILKYSDGTTATSSAVKASTNGSGQYEIDLAPDYLSQQSANPMTGPNAITVGGTCHAGDVVGINLTYNSVAYTPRYAVQSSDCSASSPLASITAGLASAIQAAMSVPTTTIGAVAYFNLYYPGASTTSGYATSLSGGATETLSIGSILTWLEVMPIFAQGRYIAGRNAVAGDIVGDYLVAAGDSSSPTLTHQAFSIITAIANSSPSAYDTEVFISTATDDLYGSGTGWAVGTVPGAAPNTNGAGTFTAANGFFGPLNGSVGATTANAGAFTTLSAQSFNVTGSTAPANGEYLPATNTVCIATNSTRGLCQDASQRLLTGFLTAVTTYTNGNAKVVPWQFSDVATSTLGSALAVTNWANAAGAALLILAKSQGGTIGTQGAVSSGNNVGAVSFQIDDGSKFQTAAQITATAAGTISSGVTPAQLVFSTTNTSGASLTALVIDDAQHIEGGGGAPTCGTGCSTIGGSDTDFTMTSGTSVSAVTANFSRTWASAPICTTTTSSTSSLPAITSISASAITVGLSAAASSINVWTHCFN